MERGIVAAFADALRDINPRLSGKSAHLLKPVTMSLFGMLNWHYLWLKPTGKLTRSDYADLVTNIIVGGIDEVA
jgi:TetR/AcrR family transcriptional regulator